MMIQSFHPWFSFDLENRHRLGLALHHDVAERPKEVSAGQRVACSLADDNPSPVLLVQRFEPRAEVHRIADDGVAHDGLGPDVARDHRARC